MVSSPLAGQTSLCQSTSLSQLSASRDAWNSLGKMSREEAMSAYITEMKVVAQKVGIGCGLLRPQAPSQVACPLPFHCCPHLFPAC